MRNKITNARSAANNVESQKIADCKAFNNAITRLVAAVAGEALGGGIMGASVFMGKHALITMVFASILVMVSAISLPLAIGKLQDMYNKKGNEQELSGGMKR